jgi:hypothetical protein
MRWARPWSPQERRPPSQRLVDRQGFSGVIHMAHQMPEPTIHIRSPQSQVVSQQLHDQGRVPENRGICQYMPRLHIGWCYSLVRLFREGVELGNGIVEGLLSEVASTVGAVQDLVADGDRDEVNHCHR